MSPDPDLATNAASPLLSPAQRSSEIVFGIIMALSITAALGITFPFNVVVGIPLYIRLAQGLTA